MNAPQSEREKLLADLRKYLIDSGMLEAHDKNAIHLSDEANRTLSVIAIAEHLADFILKEKAEARKNVLSDCLNHSESPRLECCGACRFAVNELAALTPKTTKEDS